MNDNQNREKLNMQEQETITIRNLATGYKGKHKTHIVARDINASIYAGELTCLLGANGAGKSTLLHTLSGFLPKLSGEIRIMNKEVEKYSDAFQRTHFSYYGIGFRHLTVGIIAMCSQ